MYARNSATPRPITVGSVVLIADGTVQTTGVSAKIRKDGGTWTAGGGSTSVEEGVWSYTPTQGETDCETLEVLVYKASCYQAWQEVVTTAVSTFGKVQAAGLDANTVTASALATDAVTEIQSGLSTFDAGSDTVTVGTNNDKTGYSLTTGTGLGNQTANITGNLSGSVGSVTAGVTVTTNNDKTGYELNETSRDAIIADFLAHVITKGSAGTIERAFWQAAKAQASASGEVSGTPTASAFDTDLTANSGAFDHLLIVFTSGSLAGEARPISSYSSTSGRITLQEDLTAAPSAADEFIIVPSHVHPISEIQSGLATSANQTTILARLGSWTGTGLNTILGAFRALAGKAASLTPTDISSGTTFDNTTDSLEAIRDRGDAAWAPGEAGSGDASQSTLLAVQDQVEAIAGTLGGTAISVTNRIADGGSMVIYTGDDLRVRSGTQVTVSISDAAGGIYSRLSALGASKLSWGAARPSQAAGAISGTISSITQSGSGADQVVNLVIEINDAGQSLNPADDYIWQVVSTSGSGDEYTEIEGTLDLRRRVAVPV